MKKILLLLLVALTSLTLLISCSDEGKKNDAPPSTGADADVVLPEAPEKENEILGKDGNVKFTLVVTDKSGAKIQYNVESTKNNLLDALDEGGLVKTDSEGVVIELDGEGLDSDTASWVFTKNGEAIETMLSEVTVSDGDNVEAKYTE